MRCVRLPRLRTTSISNISVILEFQCFFDGDKYKLMNSSFCRGLPDDYLELDEKLKTVPEKVIRIVRASEK